MTAAQRPAAQSMLCCPRGHLCPRPRTAPLEATAPALTSVVIYRVKLPLSQGTKSVVHPQQVPVRLIAAGLINGETREINQITCLLHTKEIFEHLLYLLLGHGGVAVGVQQALLCSQQCPVRRHISLK